MTTYLGLLVSKCQDYWSNLCVWRSDPKNLGVGHVFARQAVSMIWDFAEANPFSASSGSWESSQRWTELVLKECVATQNAAASQVSATNLSCSSPSLISTDPPYYDNVPYADLSDMFYIWLRRALQPVHPDLLGTVLVPKVEELVADPFRRGGKEEARAFFEHGIGCVFRRMREKANSRFPTTIYYAFKQTEEEDGADTITEDSSRASTGWETFLQGLIDAGWQINGTWPTRTELGNRTRSMGSNARLLQSCWCVALARKMRRWQLEKNTLVPCVTNCRLRCAIFRVVVLPPLTLRRRRLAPAWPFLLATQRLWKPMVHR